MKPLLIILTIILKISVLEGLSQDAYTAKNGITYHIGDTVTLGKGSGINGKFVYFQFGGMARSTNPDLNMMGPQYAGIKIRIKKIKNWKINRQDRIYFVTDGITAANGWLFIEDALQSGEVK